MENRQMPVFIFHHPPEHVHITSPLTATAPPAARGRSIAAERGVAVDFEGFYFFSRGLAISETPTATETPIAVRARLRSSFEFSVNSDSVAHGRFVSRFIYE